MDSGALGSRVVVVDDVVAVVVDDVVAVVDVHVAVHVYDVDDRGTFAGRARSLAISNPTARNARRRSGGPGVGRR
jgi:hypothetical protein